MFEQDGKTALIWAAEGGDQFVVRMILDADDGDTNSAGQVLVITRACTPIAIITPKVMYYIIYVRILISPAY